jgi:hypothetical protein
MTDAPIKAKRRNKPTAKVKVSRLPDGHPLKPVPPPKAPRKAPKPKPEGLEKYASASIISDNELNDNGRKLVQAMVWDGLKRDDAIKSVGITKGYAYSLLRRQAVKEHYRAELDVLRSSLKARVVTRLGDIIDQDDNLNAAVQAAKILMGDEAKGAGVTVNVTNVTPGYVIDPTRAFRTQQPTRLHPDDDILTIEQDVTPQPAITHSQTQTQELPEPVRMVEATPTTGQPAAVVAQESVGGGGLRFWKGGQSEPGGQNGSSKSRS